MNSIIKYKTISLIFSQHKCLNKETWMSTGPERVTKPLIKSSACINQCSGLKNLEESDYYYLT